MRIIAGSKRGHKLCGFEGKDIRPTTDRVKESVFNLIQPYVRGAKVLDLFAGSGALSFEALSRGAQLAVCVDRDKASREVISKNCRSLEFEDKTEIVAQDALSYLADCRRCFSLIFLDPPYRKGFISPVMEAVLKYGVLSDTGIVVLESDDEGEHTERKGFDILKSRRYGRTFITVYKKKKEGFV